jgi:hypothetical protein
LFPFVSPPTKVGVTPLLSTTWTFEIGTLPSAVTTYVHVTGWPGGMSGPGGSSASSPLVDFSMWIRDRNPK